MYITKPSEEIFEIHTDRCGPKRDLRLSCALKFHRQQKNIHVGEMRQILMAACVLIALSCGFTHGRPANDDRGSDYSMLAARAPKPEDFLDYEQRAFSTPPHENSLIPPKIRQRRQSDQRRAELETLMTLSRTAKRTNRHLNLTVIGRRRRATVNEIASELTSIHRIGKPTKHDGDPTYPLIS